ncbi:MAG TPA: iron-sulfur cluster assembly scaffold protein [Firmicutes bacterium]|nr:iron-sulfur cluster assembly scaffold protein [Bacillota bacterium]
MYTEKVLDHFLNPHNVGAIPDADGVGILGDPSCGDFLRIYIKVSDGRLADVKFEVFGCPGAIATSSILTEMVKGKTLEEAMEVTDADVAEALGGLPEWKLHCSNLGAEAACLLPVGASPHTFEPRPS